MPWGTPGNDKKALGLRVKRWQVLIIASGLLLAASFLLPLHSSGRFSSSPAGEWYRRIFVGTNAAWASEDKIAYYYITGTLLLTSYRTAPYLFGGLMAVAAAARLAGYHSLERKAARAILVLLVLAATGIILIAATYVAYGAYQDDFAYALAGGYRLSRRILALALSGLLLGYVCLARRFRPQTYPYCAFAGAAGSILVFVSCLNWGQSPPGVYLPAAASLTLLLSMVAEQITTARQSWWVTVTELMLCRLPEERGTCPDCGYYLFGLTEMRCPECGEPFTFEEVGMTPEELGFRSPDQVSGR